MATAIVNAAVSVLGKALAPLTNNLLKNWAASEHLGDNVEALEHELLSVKALLEPTLGREIDNSALKELLLRLQGLAYDADDVLDELDYFRIQDELDGTSEAADAHNLRLNLQHTARAVANQIGGLPARSPPGTQREARNSDDTIVTSPQHTSQHQANQELNDGRRQKLACGVCDTIVHAVGKCFPCSPLSPARDDDDVEEEEDNNALPLEVDQGIITSPHIATTNDESTQTMHNYSWRQDQTTDPPKLSFNRVDASTRMQSIVEKLRLVRKDVSNTIKTLGPNWSAAPNIAHGRPMTTSQSIEPTLYGRDRTMNSIIHDITQGKHSVEQLTVIPILGVGGIGKTTLAQHIYDSKQVREHFEVKVWKCVSFNFSANNLIQDIKKYIPKIKGENNTSTAGELIGQRLKKKRFLLVLDDIWDCSSEDEWKRLLVPFEKSEVHGNIIIVTTRRPEQTQMMILRKNDHPISLQGLDHKEFMELFLAIVFGNDHQSRKDHTYLLKIGNEIARKLKGSPLAAKTVGRLLKIQLDMDHWNRVLKSKEWEEKQGNDEIMPALKLSYDYLPLHLKPCFSFCALFPQDYKFQQQELINFWIGLEILHSSPSKNKRVEDIGLNHLTELVNHGFFEKVREKKNGSSFLDSEKIESDYYILHDLLHDLARKVSSHECLSINSSQSQVRSLSIRPSIRHLSINIDDSSIKDRLSMKNCVDDFKTLHEHKFEKLRTLMLFGKNHGRLVKVIFGDLFREAKALRVVFLSETSYNVEDLLLNFYNLVHLRYLRILCPEIRDEGRFRNKLSRFYHMMVLDAKQFHIIPTGMSNLVKLRHFHVQNSYIPEVGKLKSLQELREFWVTQEGQGFELKQIGNLVELCGSLCIANLENIQAVKEADEAKLMDKSRLHELILCWSWTTWESNHIPNCKLEEHVLERLEPSSNLQKLTIRGNRGRNCPSWLGTNLSVENLESLCLDDVTWETFPPIGELEILESLCLDEGLDEEIPSRMPEKRFKNLRRLELTSLPQFERWVVHDPCQLFPSLEEIEIRFCSNLVELSFSHSACCRQQELGNVFPKLSSFKIESCPMLWSFPILLPWTNEGTCSIRIGDAGSWGIRLGCGEETKYDLSIFGNKSSTFWNLLAFDNLTKLERFDMYKCQPPPLHHLQKLSSLRHMGIMSCSSNALKFFLDEGDSHVEYQFPVESLVIEEWSASGKDLTQLLSYFPKLSSLELIGAEKITGLGVMEQQATATPGPSSSSGNKLDEQRQQQDARTEERLVALEAAEGLLLLPPQLQELWIDRCCLHSNPLDDNKEDGGTIGGGGLQGLSSLRVLSIMSCPKILSSYYSSSSPSSCFPFPNSLEELYLFGRVGMETLVPLSNLNSLTSLSVHKCGDLRGGGLLSLLAQGNLTELFVSETPNFFVASDPSQVLDQVFPSRRSSKLQHLKTDDVVGFTVATISSLLFSSLTKLEFDRDEMVEHFTEEQEDLLLVNSLEEIQFWSCNNLQYLPARLHSLPRLKRLSILGCKAIQMLPKDGLPSSLQELEIYDCPEIQSLPKVDNLPSSLRELDVERCGSEELKVQCRKLIGIIPIVKV